MAETSGIGDWANIGPKIPIKIKIPTRTRPTSPAGLRAMRRSVVPSDRAARVRGLLSRAEGIVVVAAMLTPLGDAHARVERAVHDVRQEVGHDDGDRDNQEDALHHRVIAGV